MDVFDQIIPWHTSEYTIDPGFAVLGNDCEITKMYDVNRVSDVREDCQTTGLCLFTVAAGNDEESIDTRTFMYQNNFDIGFEIQHRFLMCRMFSYTHFTIYEDFEDDVLEIKIKE